MPSTSINSFLNSLVLLPWGGGVLNLFTAYIAPLIYYEHCQLNQAWSSKYTCLLYNTHCMHILASCNNCDWRLWAVDAFSLYADKLVLVNPSFPFRILGLGIGIFPKSGKIPMPNPPPFSNICPRYARWGIPFIGVYNNLQTTDNTNNNCITQHHITLLLHARYDCCSRKAFTRGSSFDCGN